MDPKVHETYYKETARRDIAVNQAAASASSQAETAWYAAIQSVANSTGPNANAALIALAMARPQGATPVIQEISRPERGSDYTKMVLGATGIIGAVRAFDHLTDALSNASGTVYNLTSGGNISGSANQRNITQRNIGGDATAKKCEDCDKGIDDKKDLHDPGEMPDICPATGTFRDGTWWVSPGSQCSCESRKAGRC